MLMHVEIGGDLPLLSLEGFQKALLSDDITEVYMNGHLLNVNVNFYCLRDDPVGNFMFETEMQIDRSTQEPVSSLFIDEYCEKNNLTIRKLLPPYTDESEVHFNECYYYWRPGMDGFECYPTDGESKLVIRQECTIGLFKQLWYLHITRAKEDCPLLINDNDVYTRDYVQLVLQGKTFDEIYLALLKKHVGCEPPVVPLLHIIK